LEQKQDEVLPVPRHEQDDASPVPRPLSVLNFPELVILIRDWDKPENSNFGPCSIDLFTEALGPTSELRETVENIYSTNGFKATEDASVFTFPHPRFIQSKDPQDRKRYESIITCLSIKIHFLKCNIIITFINSSNLHILIC